MTSQQSGGDAHAVARLADTRVDHLPGCDYTRRFAAELAAQWGGPLRVIHAPLIEIAPIKADCEAPDAVIFTSANGVAAAASLHLPKEVQAWCVGPKTAELAQAAGFVPTVGPGDAEGLVSDIIAAKPLGRLAHIRGRHARGEISARLNTAGISCMDVVAYDQIEQPLTTEAKKALAGADPVFLPLFSPRTATILNKQGPFAAPVHVIALSEAVKAAVSAEVANRVTLAERPDGQAMLAAVLAALQAQVGGSQL